MNEPVARECATADPADAACAAPIYRLYGQAYDFRPPVAGSSTEFMLAALPRAGSTYLAVELWRTGVMGAPMEYPNQPFHNAMHQRLGTGNDLIAYWEAVKRVRTSPNGIFGFKMFVSDYMRISERHPELLAHMAPRRIVFITRANVVEQAVSYSKAIRSGQWFPDTLECTQERTRIAYDAEHIRWCMATIEYQLDVWNKLFVLMGTTPHHVRYEELVANPAAVVRGIADFLGVELDPDAVVDLPHTQIQRNHDSAAWVRRFKAEQAGTDMQSKNQVTMDGDLKR